MNLNRIKQPFTISEWDWFCLRLQLYSLDNRSDDYAVYFNLENPQAVICRIYSEQTEQLLDLHASTDEQMEYYQQWIYAEKHHFADILVQLPAMREEFDVNEHVAYQIMNPAPGKDEVVCEVRNRHIIWR